MTDCDQYLEDPEAHAAHLESCAECSAIARELDDAVEIAPRPLKLDALPLAPWEGASHRTWPLVAAGVAALVVLASVLWIATDLSPLRELASRVPSWAAVVKMLQLTGRAMGAPIVAVLFVAINTILFFLLRRAPKGLDVS
jgi:hypothetical protein